MAGASRSILPDSPQLHDGEGRNRFPHRHDGVRGVDVDRVSRVGIGHTECPFVNGIRSCRPQCNNARDILYPQELINWLSHGARLSGRFF